MTDNLTFSSIVKAMMHAFEMSASEMIREWKGLSVQDKLDFDKWLRAEGYDYPAPTFNT